MVIKLEINTLKIRLKVMLDVYSTGKFEKDLMYGIRSTAVSIVTGLHYNI